MKKPFTLRSWTPQKQLIMKIKLYIILILAFGMYGLTCHAQSAIENKQVVTSEDFTVNGVTFKMIHVEGGTYTMGSNEEVFVVLPEPTCVANPKDFELENPAHEVTISSFYIGQTEVTQELWIAVMGFNPSYFNSTGNPDYESSHEFDYGTNLQRPVEHVSWDDCQVFINKLNQLTGKNFRLPTEAEWEYAARGGNKSQGHEYSGSKDFYGVAWCIDNIPTTKKDSQKYGTQPVATKKSNELGIYDMSGNVIEWCNDYWDESYYKSSPKKDPKGPKKGKYRISRGGGWGGPGQLSKVNDRAYFEPTERGRALGFRLALQ